MGLILIITMLKSEEIINKIKKDLILSLKTEKISKFEIQIEEINKSKNLEYAFSYKKNCSGETKASILNGCGNTELGTLFGFVFEGSGALAVPFWHYF